MRKRILLVIGGTLVVMMIILVTVSWSLILESFTRLERRYLELDIQRVTNAIDAILTDLNRMNDDWASWDDSYAFMRDRSPAYIAANITDDVFENLRLNAILFLDAKGQVVFGEGYDFSTQRTAAVPAGLVDWLSRHPAFWRFEVTETHARGIMLLPQGPLLAVSRPIITSRRAGPVRGALVMAVFLDDREAARLAESLRTSLVVTPVGSRSPESAAEKAALAAPPGAAPVLDTSRADRVFAYTVLRDVDGAPAVGLRVDEPRDIHRQGVLTLQYFIVWLLFIGIVFGAVVILFVEKTILARLLRLSSGVLAVGTGGDPGRRVPAGGTDQIAYLGAAINGMLDALGRSTEDLRASERRNEAFLDAVPDMIFRITRDGNIMDARSPTKLPLIEAARNLLGKDPEQIIALYSFISPEHYERSLAATRAALDSGAPQALEYSVDVEGGRRHYQQRFVASGENEVIVLLRDVTAVKQAEEARGKEVLLKEIHHRVKNNLQVISSLLALQAGSAADAVTRALLNESRDRVRSMALIHEKLYQTGDQRGISFASYVQDLAAHLRHSYAGNSPSVSLDIDIEEVSLEMDLSVPCGLILNELLSNALKHAFPGGRVGTVGIRMRRQESGELLLTVTDDGVGFPPGIDARAPATLGLRIVNILVSQIRGTLTMPPGPRTTFAISFPAS
jgi:two-component sensor histidine kinase/sensor domain CHASE-containing protein